MVARQGTGTTGRRRAVGFHTRFPQAAAQRYRLELFHVEQAASPASGEVDGCGSSNSIWLPHRWQATELFQVIAQPGPRAVSGSSIGIGRALQGLSRRVPAGAALQDAEQVLQRHYAEYRKEGLLFLRELEQHLRSAEA